jgi:hypothetical protein
LSFIAHGPAFDRDVQLVSPGYNARSKIFSVSQSVEPRAQATHLTKFLDEVSFRDQASRANYVALLLTGLFPQHWLGTRPMGWIDANQSVVGKTMLAQCCAAIVSGGDVGTIRFSPDEAELEKLLATRLQADNVLILDNAKKSSGEVSSAVMERCITDSHLVFRRLGNNTTLERHNNVGFMCTMNQSQLSRDLITRSLPVRLLYEGNPLDRVAPIGDPKEYFTAHRLEIAGELLGMVQKWIAAEKPTVDAKFRFASWARNIGGILHANGILDFLANLHECTRAFDEELSALQQLATVYSDDPQKASTWTERLRAEGLLAAYVDAPEASATSRVGKLLKRNEHGQFRSLGGRVARLESAPARGGTTWRFETYAAAEMARTRAVAALPRVRPRPALVRMRLKQPRPTRRLQLRGARWSRPRRRLRRQAVARNPALTEKRCSLNCANAFR